MDPLVEFRTNISPFMEDWNSIQLRAIALPSQIGLQLHSMRITLRPESKSNLPTNVTEIGDIVTVEDSYEIDKLDELLDMIVKGEVKAGERVIHLKKQEQEKWTVVRAYSCYFQDRERSRDMFGLDNACFAVEAYDSTQRSNTDMKRWDGFLMSSSAPYDGIMDLRRDFLGQTRSSGYTYQEIHFEIIAALGVKFAPDSRITDDGVQLGIFARQNANPAAIAIASIVKGKTRTERRRFSVDIQERFKEDAKISKSLPLARPVEWVRCLLMYHGIEADRLELPSEDIVAENPKWQVFAEIAGGTDGLGDIPDGRYLESHVEVMFHLLGFSTAHYGGRDWPTHKPIPDIVAFPDREKWFLVLECTEREADVNNKLTRLSTRTKELSRAVHGFKPYPVLVTALDKAMINKTDEEKAEKERIVILSRDDLMDLHRAVVEGKTPAEIKSRFIRPFAEFYPGIR